jgi:hypothetical protein
VAALISIYRKEEKIAAEDILMTNWIKEIDPEAGLQDVNS